MEFSVLITYVNQALLLILLLSLPVIVVASITGLALGFLQAVTQVQDQTISFGVKLIAIIVTIALTSSWLGGELYMFGDQMFGAIAGVR
jgi:type III secretion protein S